MTTKALCIPTRVPAPHRLPAHDRRVLASQVAWRLGEQARACDGFASAEIRVALPWWEPSRPEIAVVLAPMPADPIVTVAPLLVVELAPVFAAQAWLDRGVTAVWTIGEDGALVSPATGRSRWVDAPGVLTLGVPGRERRTLTLTLPLYPQQGAGRPVGGSGVIR